MTQDTRTHDIPRHKRKLDSPERLSFACRMTCTECGAEWVLDDVPGGVVVSRELDNFVGENAHRLEEIREHYKDTTHSKFERESRVGSEYGPEWDAHSIDVIDLSPPERKGLLSTIKDLLL